MRGITAAAIAAATCSLLLAGCSDGPGGAGGATPTGPCDPAVETDCGGLPEQGHAGPPAWSVGDRWVYTTIEGNTTDYVVTTDQGDDYFVDTSTPSTAFLDARTDVSRLGPQRKADLAGSQGTERVEFFRWPIMAHANWTTIWDGQDVTIHSLGADPRGIYLYEARNQTGLFYSYGYDPEARWFSHIHRHGGDGSVVFSLTLQEASRGWKGDVVRYTLETIHSAAGTDYVQQSANFEAKESWTDLWVSYTFDCGANGGYAVAIRPLTAPDPTQGYLRNEGCTTVRYSGVAQADPAPGMWVYEFNAGGPQPPTYTVLLLARTLASVPVG